MGRGPSVVARPEKRGTVRVGSESLLGAQLVPAPSPANQGLHPLQVLGLCPPWDIGGSLSHSVPSHNGLWRQCLHPQQNLGISVTGMGREGCGTEERGWERLGPGETRVVSCWRMRKQTRGEGGTK